MKLQFNFSWEGQHGSSSILEGFSMYRLFCSIIRVRATLFSFTRKKNIIMNLTKLKVCQGQVLG